MSTRRNFLAGLAVSPLAARSLWAKAGRGDMLFVGTGTKTGSKGIYAYRFDPSAGGLTPLGLAAEAPSPSFIAKSPDERFLFAVNEIDAYQGTKSGAVSSYALNKNAGKLALINTVASGGAGPCHLSTDHTGRALVVANYSGGSAASFQVGADGRLSEAVSEFHYASPGPGAGQDKERQEASHAHRATITPDNGFVLINDLGLDRIHIYKLDAATAKLTPNDPSEWKGAAGSGPRALRFHPSGRWAYCVNELASTIDQLAWNGATGTLTQIGETSLLAGKVPEVTTASEIVFDSAGRFAYVSVRGHDFLATLDVDLSNGKLSLVRRSTCGGKVPRHITLDPSQHWLLVANQESNAIAVLRRNEKTGELAADGPTYPIQSPQCLVFV